MELQDTGMWGDEIFTAAVLDIYFMYSVHAFSSPGKSLHLFDKIVESPSFNLIL